MNDDLETRLRRALASSAEEVQPAGDGLSRIRARTSGRRPWRQRWGMPALALAGVAAVLAAVVVLPRVLPSSADDGRVIPGAAATATTPATPTASTDPLALEDLPAVWPYGSRGEGRRRADADVASGRYPDLADPAATAEDFVASYVGPAGIEAERLGPYQQGLRMLVRRDGVPVSTVFLVRVRVGNDSPYVVVSAERTDGTLDIGTRPQTRTTDPAPVGGTVRPVRGAEPTVVVELREPGSDDQLALSTAPVTGGSGSWATTLTPLRVPAPHGVVAAWTADADGKVLQFVAAPTA